MILALLDSLKFDPARDTDAAAAEVAAAERGREGVTQDLGAQLEEVRLASRSALLEAEESALASKQAAKRLEAERDELTAKLRATQDELLRSTDHVRHESRRSSHRSM